jgi:thioesterase domain-containing protein
MLSSLGGRIVAPRDPIEESLVVAARSEGTKPAVWSIHPVGGSVLWIRRLARDLPEDQPIRGIQARGLDGEHVPFSSIPSMARHYVSLVRQVQPEGPYLLSGASFGGVVAFEMAQQLTATGARVELLALFDTFGPGYPARRTFWPRLTGVLRRAGDLPWAHRPAFLWSRLHRDRGAGLTSGLGDLAGAPMVRGVQNVIAANLRALAKYDPQPYAGPIVLFRAMQRPRDLGEGYEDPDNGWSKVAPGRVDVIPIDGDHRFILDPPTVDELSLKFAACVRRITERLSSP